MKRFLLALFAFTVLGGLIFSGCKKDDTTTEPPPGPTPITDNLFPVVAGHSYGFVGFAVTADSGRPIPDPNHVYKTKWTIGPSSPYGGNYLSDSTTVQTLAGPFTKGSTLLVRKDTTNDIAFMQTLGPFFRAFHINRTDTSRWVVISSQRAGVGGGWTALDSTYTSPLGAIRLQILGKVDGTEDITDSSANHTVHHTYKVHTYRNVYINGTLTVPNAMTSEIWLEKDFGPVRVNIYPDGENIGHFRILSSSNF